MITIFIQLLEIPLFIIAVITCFYLPGKFLSTKLKCKLTYLEDVFFNTIFGMLVFTLIAYVSSWIGIFWLTAPAIIFLDFLLLRQGNPFPKQFDKTEKSPLLLIILFSIIFTSIMLTSGEFGSMMKLIGSNADDGLYHLELINELRSSFPPQIPVLAGAPLKGYHFFYDFLIAKISLLFPISTLSLFFRFFPLLISLSWGIGVYVVMKEWGKERTTALWAVFLTFFAGSFGFILYLQGHTQVNLDSVFGIDQPATTHFNPPFAVSFPLLTAALFCIQRYLKEKNIRWLIPLTLCGGLITMFKVYAGIILLGSLVILTALEVLKKRFALFLALAVMGLLFICTYGVFADPTSRLFLQPFWPPQKIFDDNIPWYGYSEKMYTYSKYHVIRGIVGTELYVFAAFFIGNLGSRIIGMGIFAGTFLRRRTLPTLFSTTIFTMMMISILVPLLFLQTGKVFEIIQMAWYFLFFASLFAAFGVGQLFTLKVHRLIKYLFFTFILAITLVSALSTYRQYNLLTFLQTQPVPHSFIAAGNFMRTQGSYTDTVLELPPASFIATKKSITTWYYTAGPRATWLMDKRAYASYANYPFPNAHLDQRLDFVRSIIQYEQTSGVAKTNASQRNKIKRQLAQNNIRYLSSPSPHPLLEKSLGLKKIFQNEAVTIYQYRG